MYITSPSRDLYPSSSSSSYSGLRNMYCLTKLTELRVSKWAVLEDLELYIELRNGLGSVEWIKHELTWRHFASDTK